ncbi:MAG: ligase-associated DNA damage response endonuclease PdeM [Verrucomicrobiales bacterium]|nr:ligase-associated DNA damage response endonuclease PdeM [Verrucomicrobiales bacterium]
MKTEIEVRIGDERLLLLAGKALYWPDRRALCIADPHFGKAAAYRSLGQPVPHGTTADNLSRLDTLLSKYPCSELVVLGDFLHAPESHASLTLSTLHAWRSKHAHLTCTLIRGNHDRRAGDPPSALAFKVVDEPWRLGPLAFRHTPTEDATHHVIAGHVHPVFQWSGKGRQSVRLPCFQLQPRLTLLPAFGEFTGGTRVERPADGLVVVTDGCQLWSIGAMAPT